MAFLFTTWIRGVKAQSPMGGSSYGSLMGLRLKHGLCHSEDKQKLNSETPGAESEDK